MTALLHWDERAFSFFHSWSADHTVAAIFALLTYLGDGLFVVFTAVAIWIWERYRRRTPARTAAAIFWTYLSSGLLAQVLKHLIRRPRPFGHDPSSFPSGHAASAFALALVLAWRWPRLGWLFWLLAALVGVSRIVLGHHYPLDVVAGALLGTLTAWGYLRWTLRRNRRETTPSHLPNK
ncbi:MAG: phosphatase PAP2 family protein [Firmicutes bacterium]|nr:phosphatase PAP2 family protein [Bacillota bacterium]